MTSFKPSMFDKLFDQLGSRIRTARLPDERKLYPHLFNHSAEPELTVGTIVFRALVKTTMIVLLSWFAMEQFAYELQHTLFIPPALAALSLIYFVAVLPAYHQYQRFYRDSKRLVGDTLCAKCRHFDSTGIICTLYDEHISRTYTPCGGDAWEAKQPFDNE
jgi:hypothetical protein